MARTAAPAIPGTDPAAAPVATPIGDSPVAATPPAPASEPDMLAIVKAQQAQIEELKAAMGALSRNQVAQAMPEKVELPELEDVMKRNPSVAVLTKQGWFVPAVHPTDRLAKA